MRPLAEIDRGPLEPQNGTTTPEDARAQEDYRIAISPETRELLGIDPLQMFQAYEAPNKLVAHLLDGLQTTIKEEIDGNILSTPEGSNTILFPVRFGSKVEGLFEYPSFFKAGSNGVGVTSIPEPIQHDEMLKVGRVELGHAKSQYDLIAVGNDNSTNLEGVYIISMEGGRPFVNFKEKGEDKGIAEVAHRLTRLAGGRHITKTLEDRSMPIEEWESSLEKVREVIKAGEVLAEKKLLPHVGIELYTDEDDRRRIQLFLEVSGVSEGQISLLHNGTVFVTGTGTNKGNLDLHEVVPLVGLHYDENDRIKGSVAKRPAHLNIKRPSVEGPENLMVYAATAGIASGDIDEPDITKVSEFLSDNERVLSALRNPNPYQSIVHIHRWHDEDTIDNEHFAVYGPNHRLMPNGAYHSSCGTEAQAFNVVDAVVRGAHTEKQRGYNRILIVPMPNHGMTMVSPYPLGMTVEMIAEVKASGMQFLPVPPR